MLHLPLTFTILLYCSYLSLSYTRLCVYIAYCIFLYVFRCEIMLPVLALPVSPTSTRFLSLFLIYFPSFYLSFVLSSKSLFMALLSLLYSLSTVIVFRVCSYFLFFPCKVARKIKKYYNDNNDFVCELLLLLLLLFSSSFSSFSSSPPPPLLSLSLYRCHRYIMQVGHCFATRD